MFYFHFLKHLPMQAILLAHAGYFVGPCTLTVPCGLCQHVENKCDRPEGITHTYNARQENNSTLCLRYRILSFYWIYFISHISIRLLWRYRYSIEVTLAEFKWEGQQTETLCYPSQNTALPSHSPIQRYEEFGACFTLSCERSALDTRLSLQDVRNFVYLHKRSFSFIVAQLLQIIINVTFFSSPKSWICVLYFMWTSLWFREQLTCM